MVTRLAKSTPFSCSRKPWTKCCRDCSPSLTMSMPASSCSLSARMVASRLASASAWPVCCQGAHRTRGVASHAGLGKLPAIVVSSMAKDPPVNSGGILTRAMREGYSAWSARAPRALLGRNGDRTARQRAGARAAHEQQAAEQQDGDQDEHELGPAGVDQQAERHRRQRGAKRQPGADEAEHLAELARWGGVLD